MKIQFCFYVTSSKEECKVVIEVTCPKKPRIKVGDQFTEVYPIENYKILDELSSSNWKDRFLIGISPDRGVSVYGYNPTDVFDYDLPEIIEK